MRNPAFTLTPEQVAAANTARGQIVTRPEGALVRITGVKRSGAARTYVGTLAGIVGTDSHEAVKIDTLDGPKSMNLYNVSGVFPA